MFRMGGWFEGDGIAHVQLGRLVSLVGGDTLHTGRAKGASQEWIVTVRADSPGEYEIRGSLGVRENGNLHEVDLSLPFRLGTDSAVTEPSHVTRAETVRGGQRYRYGGRFLVPIDHPEEFIQADIELHGSRATGPEVLEARCGKCPGSGLTIRMVVFINSEGAVQGASPVLPWSGLGEQAVEAAREYIGRFEFRAARLGGKTVADWGLVDVHVMAGDH